jgi:hypothetical protein
MTVILRVASQLSVFSNILPPDMEEIIALGKQNLQRFRVSIAEFDWHLSVLSALDRAQGNHGAS